MAVGWTFWFGFCRRLAGKSPRAGERMRASPAGSVAWLFRRWFGTSPATVVAKRLQMQPRPALKDAHHVNLVQRKFVADGVACR